MRVHIATSRLKEIGQRCIDWASTNGLELTSMEECDVFVSVLYDQLLTKEYIDSRSCFNFHPGILPDYRGSGVYSWVLINRERETGVTLHKVDYNVDSGPIIAIEKTLIGEHDTAETLFVRCMDILFEMFIKHLESLLLGAYKTYPNDGGRLYLRKDLEDARDISGLVKGLTFSRKGTAYWIDSKGDIHYIDWE